MFRLRGAVFTAFAGRKLRFALVVVAAGFLVLLAPSPSEALKKRPVGGAGSYAACTQDLVVDRGSTWAGCEGAICYCCYSNGCWVCDADGRDCVWDAKQKAVQGTTSPVTGGQTLATQEQGVVGGGTQPFQVQGGQVSTQSGTLLQQLQPELQQLHQVEPVTILQPTLLECWTVTNTHTATTRVHVRNTTGQEIAVGQHVSWSSGSVADTMELPRPLEAGNALRLGPPYPTQAVDANLKCRAWIGAPRPVLAQ
jgi:hypothetical protein